MDGIRIFRFEDPDEMRVFDLGKFELIHAAGMTIGRAEYEPGWRWSEHVGKAIGQTLCPTPHLGMVLSGRNRVEMADGTFTDLRPGDIFEIGPGHDSWVLGRRAVRLAPLPRRGGLHGPLTAVSPPLRRA